MYGLGAASAAACSAAACASASAPRPAASAACSRYQCNGADQSAGRAEPVQQLVRLRQVRGEPDLLAELRGGDGQLAELGQRSEVDGLADERVAGPTPGRGQAGRVVRPAGEGDREGRGQQLVAWFQGAVGRGQGPAGEVGAPPGHLHPAVQQPVPRLGGVPAVALGERPLQDGLRDRQLAALQRDHGRQGGRGVGQQHGRGHRLQHRRSAGELGQRRRRRRRHRAQQPAGQQRRGAVEQRARATRSSGEHGPTLVAAPVTTRPGTACTAAAGPRLR